ILITTNRISTLDFTKNINLISINCGFNKLTNLDLSNNTALLSLNCSGNRLKSLDFSKNTELNTLFCGFQRFGGLENLNVTQNRLLENFACQEGILTNLDLSNNTDLTHFNCEFNDLRSLDLSQNNKLRVFQARANELEYVNLKNGGNADNLLSVQLKLNPNLSCIKIDNINIPESKDSWSIDDTAYYSEDCETLGVHNIKEDILSISVFPNPVSDELRINSVENLKEINLYTLQGKLIKHHLNSSKMNVSNLNFGLYIFEAITVNGDRYTDKVFKI
ncbi:T9SS type A sorting domain-containing protein, partial [Aquimarina sp. AD1]